MRVAIPQLRVTDVDRINMAIECDDTRPVANAAEEIAHGVNGDFVVTNSQHFLARPLDDRAFFRAQ